MSQNSPAEAIKEVAHPPHPRTIGWIGTTALAMGGSNQSLFLLAGAGGLIASQGSAAVLLLILGLLLAYAAAPGWTELILMSPNKVGGIAASCTQAFKPYSPQLASLTGTCYWWGWIPTCGLCALLSATAIHKLYLPSAPIPYLATGIVLLFTCINLAGIKHVVQLAVPLAICSAALAFISGIVPVLTGHVNWRQATTFGLLTTFPGLFGKVTSAMSGLYLVGFAAPAFEAAACHVGETIDPFKNVPRAMKASAGMAAVYFFLLPLVWLGVFGTTPMLRDLQDILGPTFAPLLGPAANAAAVWFMMLNMFHGTLQPLAGASRTLSQMSEDGLMPEVFAKRSRTDCPWVATLITAGMAIVFLSTGDPTWVIAAANLTYLIGISLPNIAVWLLRRDAPERERPYRAPDWTINLGVGAAIAWGVSTILGFQQFGLPTVIAGVALAYSGSVLYAARAWSDRRKSGEPSPTMSLHTKLSGAMLAVLTLDASGYLLAISHVPEQYTSLIAGLEDIFVMVALLTITVGLVLPGMIGHAAAQIAGAARRLANGTLKDFSKAMVALGEGRLAEAHARFDIVPVTIRTGDEMAEMAYSFNTMQLEIARAVNGLEEAREGIRATQASLTTSNERFELAVEGSRDGLWDWDLITNATYLSPRWKAILGYEDDEIPSTFEWWLENVHPDDVQSVKDKLDDCLIGNTQNYVAEVRMRHKDGTYRWTLSRGVALFHETGFPYRMAGSQTDITDFKKAELDRQRLSDYNRLLLEFSQDGIYGIDKRGRCTFINRAAASMLGYTQDEVLGQDVHDLMHHSYADGSVYLVQDCPIYGAMHAGRHCRVDTEVFWKKDGTSIPVEYTSAPIIDEGVVRGAVITIIDVTARKRAEAELLQAKLDAEAASRAKSQFLANMSHELRTPLNAIIGFSEILQDQMAGPLNTKQSRYVDNALTSGRHLLDLINGILDLSKVEAGFSTLEYMEFDPAEYMNRVVSVLKPLYRKKSIEVRTHAEEGLPRIKADPGRFTQILYNLVANAIKFTPDEGAIDIDMRSDGESLRVSVKDTGIGLSAENIERIWGEFEQVDSSYARLQQGTGLGLALTRLLVQLHGGRVWAESDGEDQGSTFTFVLPWNPPAPAEPLSDQQSANGKHPVASLETSTPKDGKYVGK